MSRLVIYIPLSIALHVFAVFPLLAEQLSGSPEVVTALPERSVLTVPRVVVKSVLATAEPTVEPVKKPIEQPVAPSKPLPDKPVKPKPMVASQLLAKPKVRRPEISEEKAKFNLELEIESAPAVAQKAEHVVPEATDSKVVTPAAEAAKPSAAQSVRAEPLAAEIISKEPRFARAPAAPVYPAQAKRRQQQGTVWVDVRLGAQGQQVALHVLRSSGVPSLDKAALAAVRKWQFLPETRNGMGVPSRVHIPIEFAIAAHR